MDVENVDVNDVAFIETVEDDCKYCEIMWLCHHNKEMVLTYFFISKLDFSSSRN